MTNIAMHGHLFVGPYKGYHGRAEYDPDAGIYHGRVTTTKDVITFEGSRPTELASAFADSINDYLEFCDSRGESPEKPFSGNFPVRVTPKLHRDLTVAAMHVGKSLNHYVTDVLEASLSTQAETPSARHYMVDTNVVYQVLDPVSTLLSSSTTPSRPFGNVQLEEPDYYVNLPGLRRFG